MQYVKYDNRNGKIITVYNSEINTEFLYEYEKLIVVDNFDNSRLNYVEDGRIVSVDIPKYPCIFDYETKNWNQDFLISNMKKMKSKELFDTYLKKKNSFFIYKDKKIATDENSLTTIDSINGFILMSGTLPENWIGGWKTLDNTYLEISDVEDWKLFYSAKTTFLNNCFIKFQELKSRLSSVTSIEEADALVW